jgi:apolipoprotein N-acyltransferase
MPFSLTARGPLVALGLIGASALIGAGHLQPGWAVMTWVGLAVMGMLLTCEAPRTWVIAGLLLGGLAEQYVGHPWHVTFLDDYVPGGMAVAVPLSVLIHVGMVLPQRLPLVAGWLLGRRFRWPVVAWFPIAWVIGEALNDAFSGISHEAWLYSQWQVEPVLRAVGHLGWVPALLLCLAIAVAGGESLARRAGRLALVPLLGIVVLALLPPLPKADVRAFEGVGVVHMGDPAIRPTAAPPGIDLLIWPEAMLRRPMRVSERKPAGRVAPPLAGVSHLIGAHTRSEEGLQNSLLTLGPDGTVSAMRAKRRLFAMTERPVFGLAIGPWQYAPGTAPPVVSAGNRRVLGLICVEASDRGLVAEGVRAGADLMAICADERALHGAHSGGDQMLAVAVMRAVEFRLPVVRAAIEGPAALIGPDGRVLAVTAQGRHGILTARGDVAFGPVPYDPPAGGQVAAPLEAAVLYSTATPTMLAALPGDRARHFAVEGFDNPGVRAKTVVLAGHSLPPSYLDQPAEQVAAAIASFEPELVVLDTCYGASTPILEALVKAGSRAVVVAPPYRIPRDGFVYAPDFFAERDPARRAALVRTEPAFPLLRWRPESAALVALRDELAGLDTRALRKRLQRVSPPLVKSVLPGQTAPGAVVLTPVTADRFRAAPTGP